MWVPVQRTAEDMFVDMGDSDPVGQTAQAVQVNFNPFLDVNMLMTKKKHIDFARLSNNNN